MMQYVGRHYVPYINHTYGTSGSLWEGRYNASLIDDDEYLLTCMRYIEWNPVRAEIVRLPRQYRWSSCRSNGQGKVDKLVKPHPIYKMLGKAQSDCLEAYRALFKAHLEEGVLDTIRSAWQTGTPLGNDYFRQKIEAKLKCKVRQARRGRPVKPKGEISIKGLCPLYALTPLRSFSGDTMLQVLDDTRVYCVEKQHRRLYGNAADGYRRRDNDHPGWQPILGCNGIDVISFAH